MKYLLLLGVMSLALTACDRSCKYTVEDWAKFDNQTGQTLNLTVCVGNGLQKKDIEILAGYTGDLDLGPRQATYIAAGAESCSRDDGEIQRVGVALTSASFTTAKFCYQNSSTADIRVIPTNQSCPSGTSEQVLPVDTCPN